MSLSERRLLWNAIEKLTKEVAALRAQIEELKTRPAPTHP